MENLFGVPMGGLTIGVVASLLVFLLILAFFARRNPVLFKLGLRNIPRRRAQTVLIIVGLMLSTAIITAALALGDTVSSLIRNGALDALGATDVVVESPTFAGFGDEFLTAEQVDAVLASVDGDDRVDGAMPQIREDLPILNPGNGLTSVGAPILGLETSRVAGFDDIRTVDGKTFAVGALGARGILLNENMAEDLEADVGDELTVIAPIGERGFVVAAIVVGRGLAGTRGDGSNASVALVRLEAMQELLDREGLVNRIEVSLTGGSRPSPDLSEDVADDLQLEFTDDEVAEQIHASLSDPEVVAIINGYMADNEDDLSESAKEDITELVAELETGASDTKEFRSAMTDPFVAGTVVLALEEAGRMDQALATTFMLAELEVLRISEVKVSLVEIADTVGSFFTTIFGIFGSFSIMVGLLLIFLVFVMLAASRMTEMGIARAIGTKRRQLVQSFVFEGAAYAFAASVAGVILGILASVGLVNMLARILPEDVDFAIRFGLQPRSVLLAFAAGMVITLITVAISAYRVSKLNIAVAIRGLPEEFVPKERPSLRSQLLIVGQALIAPFYQLYLGIRGRRIRFLWALIALIPPVWIVLIVVGLIRLVSPYIRIGWESAILGVVLAVVGINTSSAAFFAIGASLTVVGLGMALRSVLSRTELRDEVVSRISYSFIGALLLTFWLLPFDALNWLTGELEGNIEMFILSGVFVTAAAVWVVMYNSEVIFWPVNRFLGGVGGLRPVLKAALAYPMQAKFRTGLTVAMFALIVFTLMVFAVLNEAFSNTIVNNTDRINGGYDIEATVSRELPIDDIDAAIQSAERLDPGDFEVVGGSTGLSAEARQIGPYLGEEIEERRFRRLGVNGFEPSILTSTRWELTHFDSAYGANDQEIWAAVSADPDLVIAGAGVLPTGDPFGGQFGTPFRAQGIEPDDPEAIEAFTVEVRPPLGAGGPIEKTVIGITDQLAFDGSSLVGNIEMLDGLATGDLPLTTYRFRLSPGSDPDAVSSALETEFLGNNLNATLTIDRINQEVSGNKAFNQLFQGYMGLGLLVGVASLGVVSFRAVAERRQAIGMLRAIGFKAAMIRTSFLVESSLIALIGIGLGLALGAAVSWNLLNDINQEFEGISFSVPWLTVAIIVAVAWVFSLVTTLVPAIQASRTYPAEALRYE